MPYCEVVEVEADFKDMTFDDTSNVTKNDVEQFISESDALIDSYVGARYVTPVSSAGSGLTLLKLLSRSLTAGRIKRIMEVKQEKNVDANQNILGVLLSPSQVMKILSDIRDDILVLGGAESLVSSAGFYSSNVENDVEPFVKKDDTQW